MNSENQCEMKGETLSIQDLNLLFRVHSVIIFLQINEKLKMVYNKSRRYYIVDWVYWQAREKDDLRDLDGIP